MNTQLSLTGKDLLRYPTLIFEITFLRFVLRFA
jgi:hypothetical protein